MTFVMYQAFFNIGATLKSWEWHGDMTKMYVPTYMDTYMHTYIHVPTYCLCTWLVVFLKIIFQF